MARQGAGGAWGCDAGFDYCSAELQLAALAPAPWPAIADSCGVLEIIGENGGLVWAAADGSLINNMV